MPKKQENQRTHSEDTFNQNHQTRQLGMSAHLFNAKWPQNHINECRLNIDGNLPTAGPHKQYGISANAYCIQLPCRKK